MKNLKKAQSILEYICVSIVFATVGIGTLFMMANKFSGLKAAERQTNAITSYSGTYGGETEPPKIDPDNPPPPTDVDGGTADDSGLPGE